MEYIFNLFTFRFHYGLIKNSGPKTDPDLSLVDWNRWNFFHRLEMNGQIFKVSTFFSCFLYAFFRSAMFVISHFLILLPIKSFLIYSFYQSILAWDSFLWEWMNCVKICIIIIQIIELLRKLGDIIFRMPGNALHQKIQKVEIVVVCHVHLRF